MPRRRDFGPTAISDFAALAQCIGLRESHRRQLAQFGAVQKARRALQQPLPQNYEAWFIDVEATDLFVKEL